MKKKIGLSVLFTLAAVVLMALPFGVPLRFAISPTELKMEYFSYFDLMVWGAGGNMFPFITAVIASISLPLYSWILLSKKDNTKLKKASLVLSVICAVTSVLATLLIFLFCCARVTSVIITILLLLAAGLQFTSDTAKKQKM
ncbi:MAG TPA: hypothetical protein VFD23_03210 [Clostridia bacterium]|nr:hypothetical protein [Clostridia bacterium]